jgi:sulfur carrier protein ThiS
MITLTLPTSLQRLTKQGDGGTGQTISWPSARSGTWDQFVPQLRQQFPDLAARVIADSGEVARGCALIVNGYVVRDFKVLQIEGDDELAFVQMIAGG